MPELADVAPKARHAQFGRFPRRIWPLASRGPSIPALTGPLLEEALEQFRQRLGISEEDRFGWKREKASAELPPRGGGANVLGAQKQNWSVLHTQFHPELLCGRLCTWTNELSASHPQMEEKAFPLEWKHWPSSSPATRCFSSGLRFLVHLCEDVSIEDVRAEAAVAVAGTLVEKVQQERRTNGAKVVRYPPPPPFIRAVLLVQAFVRRRAFLRSFGGVGTGDNVDEEILELAPAKPMMSIALNFVRRLKNFRWVNIEREATLVAGLVDAQAANITMRDVSAVVNYYQDKVPSDHLSLNVLQEALDRQVIVAKEALQERDVGVRNAFGRFARETALLSQAEERGVGAPKRAPKFEGARCNKSAFVKT
eukprot:g22567.t1